MGGSAVPNIVATRFWGDGFAVCGIHGILLGAEGSISAKEFERLIETLSVLSESRGKEAAGVSVLADGAIGVYKDSISASAMVRSQSYRRFLRKALAPAARSESGAILGPLAALGHSRLVTNGLYGLDVNNQPVVRDGAVCVHNGIVVNDAELWGAHPELRRLSEVDTEVILALLQARRGQGESITDAVRAVFREIEGEASIAVQFDDLDGLLLATNTGSIYWCSDGARNLLMFASEESILRRMIRSRSRGAARAREIHHLKAGRAAWIELSGLTCREFSLAGEDSLPEIMKRTIPREVHDKWAEDEEYRNAMRRCTRCLLPETMPFVTFDDTGVCSYCHRYQKLEVKGREALEVAVAPYRKGNGRPDCVVAFSGGRDSSYGLHYLKTELGLTPVAYTYDWGMVTDLARRNQSRLCGKLGIEHIWLSADIKRKRRNIRRNVEAWLKSPDLGMVPLFMAGDKQFFFYGNRLLREIGTDLLVLCENPFEQTDFKSGFSGINPSRGGATGFYRLSHSKKARLLSYYATRCLKNPSYINASIVDTLFGFFSYYLDRHKFFSIYSWIGWDEDNINRVLAEEYEWETAADTTTTWRIGDGTAPFYNYIYYTVAGFTENDTFRSNQIREGTITRDEGLRLIRQENQPRFGAIREYLQLIGLDFGDTIRAINATPRLYHRADG